VLPAEQDRRSAALSGLDHQDFVEVHQDSLAGGPGRFNTIKTAILVSQVIEKNPPG